MKIGVISDSHDQIAYIEKAVSTFNKENVELVVHCGDWVAPFTLNYFARLRCPLKGVFGNNDGDRFRHVAVAKKHEMNMEFEERFLTLDVGNKRIAVFHGDYQEIVDALVTCGTYDAVFHGHTHVSVNKRVGKTLSLNPGTLMSKTAEKIKGASFAIWDTNSNTATRVLL